MTLELTTVGLVIEPPLKEKIRESYTVVLIFPYFGAQILFRGAKPFPKIRLRRLVSPFKIHINVSKTSKFFAPAAGKATRVPAGF